MIQIVQAFFMATLPAEFDLFRRDFVVFRHEFAPSGTK